MGSRTRRIRVSSPHGRHSPPSGSRRRSRPGGPTEAPVGRAGCGSAPRLRCRVQEVRRIRRGGPTDGDGPARGCGGPARAQRRCVVRGGGRSRHDLAWPGDLMHGRRDDPWRTAPTMAPRCRGGRSSTAASGPGAVPASWTASRARRGRLGRRIGAGRVVAADAARAARVGDRGRPRFGLRCGVRCGRGRSSVSDLRARPACGLRPDHGDDDPGPDCAIGGNAASSAGSARVLGGVRDGAVDGREGRDDIRAGVGSGRIPDPIWPARHRTR